MRKPKPIVLSEERTIVVETSSPKSFKRLLILLAILMVLVILLFLLRAKSQPQPNAPEKVAQEQNSPDAIIEKFHLVSTYKGVKRWEMYSDVARLYEAQKLAYSDNIYAEYYKNNKLVSTLTADKAIINTETNATQAQGHVKLITDNGSELETDKLDWNPDTDQIKTDDRVYVDKGSDEITAIGMTADTELNNIHFDHDVHSKLRDVNDITGYPKPKPF